MSSRSSRSTTVNIPFIVLLAASVATGAVGYLLMHKSNTDEAAIYTSGTADYPKLFAAQSGSQIGGLLIAVAVLGILLAVLSLAVTRRPRVEAQDPAAPDETAVIDFDDAGEADAADTDVDQGADTTQPTVGVAAAASSPTERS